MDYSKHIQNPSQREPIFGKSMIVNPEGGYVFEIDDWQRLRRFLILGVEGGGFYESEKKLTLESAECVRRCLTADGARTVAAIVDISDRALAPKNDAAIFALAMATVYGDEATRKLAFDSLPKVCRIGTHIYQFTQAREALGAGWGRGMRRAIARWTQRNDLVSQALKYQQRNGWALRDLLRLSHAKEPKDVLDAIGKPYKKHIKPDTKTWADIPEAEGYVRIQETKDAKLAAALIEQYQLPREVVPTELLGEPEVWAALLPHMPMTALVRNLGNLSKVGLLTPLSAATTLAKAKITDETAIRKSRIHPFAILLGAKTYATGHGLRGKGEWTPVPQIIEALDSAFDLAFHNVEPTNKRFVLGIDVSSSMSWGFAGGAMSCAEAAAAMALITARTEPNYYIMGFATQFKDLGITAKDTLPTVLEKTRNHNFGGTDCAIAIKWALANKVETDVFTIFTDSDTWAGNTHACQAICDYRKQTGLPAKLAVVAFTGHARTIADGADPGSMDFVGMDASLPQALAAFIAE